MRIPVLPLLIAITGLAGPVTGCAHGRTQYAPADTGLSLERVVLYRNGVGYFERAGTIDEDVLTIRVRKDHVNDVLKSLTIVDRNSGQAVSVSMPLDPTTWASAALATLSPGQGSLAEVLDSLRGTHVSLGTTEGRVRGRIVMVEEIEDEPDSASVAERHRGQAPTGSGLGHDYKLTLLAGEELRIVRLSKVRTVSFSDGDLAMQLHRSLDASAGEGMFQQVDLTIRLTGDHNHDLSISYVIAAPIWKPTYRIVLPEAGKGKALLQGWAVVDNTSGEDWRDVKLALTSGEPIASASLSRELGKSGQRLRPPPPVPRRSLRRRPVGSENVEESTRFSEKLGLTAVFCTSKLGIPPPGVRGSGMRRGRIPGEFANPPCVKLKPKGEAGSSARSVCDLSVRADRDGIDRATRIGPCRVASARSSSPAGQSRSKCDGVSQPRCREAREA